MPKERNVRILLDFLCAGRAESSEAITRVSNFVAGEQEGSEYEYTEHRSPDGSLRLSVKLYLLISGKSEDDTIETKLDNSLPSFPPLYPGAVPRFYYQADGVA